MLLQVLEEQELPCMKITGPSVPWLSRNAICWPSTVICCSSTSWSPSRSERSRYRRRGDQAASGHRFKRHECGTHVAIATWMWHPCCLREGVVSEQWDYWCDKSEEHT